MRALWRALGHPLSTTFPDGSRCSSKWLRCGISCLVGAHGGLSARAVRQLRALTRTGSAAAREVGAERLRTGTRLIRTWQGETHAVEVAADGYLWRGEHFSSLSVIARRITGTRWSGPRFFGVASSKDNDTRRLKKRR